MFFATQKDSAAANVSRLVKVFFCCAKKSWRLLTSAAKKIGVC